MTVIAYKNGVLAADTAGWQDDLYVRNVQKIKRMALDRLFAAVGREDIIEAVADALFSGEPMPDHVSDDDDFLGMVVYASGAVVVSGTTYREVGEPRDMMALGPHAEFLYGAMLAGASAEEAVRLAIRHCAFAGGDVQVESLE